jgi:hypothetical protein
MVDVLNLPDRFGQWQNAITLRHNARRWTEGWRWGNQRRAGARIRLR